MATSVGPITNAILEGCIDKLKTKAFREQLHRDFLDPIIDNIVAKYHSYFTMLVYFMIAIMLLLVVNIYYMMQLKTR